MNISSRKISLPQFNIQKALEFVGDNSTYQKRRLLILSLVILTYALLTCRISLYLEHFTLMFLFASGAGQLLCPIYLSLRTTSLYLAAACIMAITSPLLPFVLPYAYCAMGFFGKGFFVSSLIYLNEIGGDKFRAWSMVVVFAVWGISPLVQALQSVLHVPSQLWTYAVVIAPFLTGVYLVLTFWNPSPMHLHSKREYEEAKKVLNQIAKENNRGALPYGLEGETEADQLASLSIKKSTYSDILNRPLLRKISIPLLLLWVYRDYIYFGSFILLPELGEDTSKSLILFSISEIFAVLMSYPIRLKVKRVNAFFGFVLVIAVSSLVSSFSTISAECMVKGETCVTKYVYRVSIMLIRFSIALIGNLLIAYTMEIYPANVKNIGFSLCIGVSAGGSALIPCLNDVFIGLGLSGFISFFLASALMLYFILPMQETNGKMCTESLEQMEITTVMVPLKNWATLSF